MEGGPPETLRRAMDELFEGRIATTFESGEKSRAELGWPEKNCSVSNDLALTMNIILTRNWIEILC